MKDLVTIEFDSRVRHVCRNLKEHSRDEIISALLNHERKPSCIDKVCEQLRDAEMKCNIGGEFKVKRFLPLIHCAADMFCNLALTHLKEQAISNAERQRKIDEANRIANIEQEFEAEQKDLTDPRIKSYPGAAARRGIEI